MRAGLWCRVGGAQGVLGWWCGQVVVSLCSSPIPLVSLWLRVPPKGQDYPVGMSRSQNVLFTSITCPVVVLLPFSSSSFFSSVSPLHFFSSIFVFQYLFALACSVFPSVGALHAAFARTAATVPASASSASSSIVGHASRRPRIAGIASRSPAIHPSAHPGRIGCVACTRPSIVPSPLHTRRPRTRTPRFAFRTVLNTSFLGRPRGKVSSGGGRRSRWWWGYPTPA